MRAASIVCPEESPLHASLKGNFVVSNSPWRGLTRRLRREEKGLQPYGALYCFKGRTEGFQRASGKPFGAPAGAYPSAPSGE